MTHKIPPLFPSNQRSIQRKNGFHHHTFWNTEYSAKQTEFYQRSVWASSHISACVTRSHSLHPAPLNSCVSWATNRRNVLYLISRKRECFLFQIRTFQFTFKCIPPSPPKNQGSGENFHKKLSNPKITRHQRETSSSLSKRVIGWNDRESLVHKIDITFRVNRLYHATVWVSVPVCVCIKSIHFPSTTK